MGTTRFQLRSMTKDVLNIANEVCQMARIRRGATIIFDVSRRPSDDLVLMHMKMLRALRGSSETMPQFTSGNVLKAFDARR